MRAGEFGEIRHLLQQRLGVEQRMARGQDRGLQRVHAREQNFAHQAHIGLGDQRVAGLAATPASAGATPPRAAPAGSSRSPRHRARHRDCARSARHRFRATARAISSLRCGTGLGSTAWIFSISGAAESSSAISRGVGDHVVAQHLARRLAPGFARQRLAHRRRRPRSRMRGAGQRRFGIFRPGSAPWRRGNRLRLVGQQSRAQPVPDRHHAGARDDGLLLGLARLRR